MYLLFGLIVRLYFGLAYTRTVRDSMAARGLTWAYWEFASGFGIYDQPSSTWKTELRDALFR